MRLNEDVKPKPSNSIRCPRCSSENVSCENTRKAHTHKCHECGYKTVAAPVQP